VPKETFFHLTEEKKQRIMKAAEKEFSKHPLKDASIANIVKDAEIPRGSFYQYFEDKEDLYYYYFHNLQKSSFRDLLKTIREHEGDLFAGFECFSEKMITNVLKDEHASFYRNLFMNMDYHSFNKVSPEMSPSRKLDARIRREQHMKDQQKMWTYIDQSNLKIEDTHELRMLLHMLMHSVFSTIIEAYRHLAEDEHYDVNQSIKDLQRKISWIKSGACQSAHESTVTQENNK
jgi:AcrR family transcriptional regulator